MRPLRALFGFILAAALLVTTAPVSAQEVDRNLWVTDGPMYMVKRVGDVLYASGAFSSVGPYTGGGTPVDLATAARTPNFPIVRGNVRACTPDGAGGWFIGGIFDTVGGVARQNFAHVRADLTVGPLDIAPNGAVSAIVLEGTTLYIGGQFLSVSGVLRGRLAAIDVTSGALLSWAPTAYGSVSALLAYGGNLYVGGVFDNISGSTRYGLASLDLATGAVTPWDPNLTGPTREVRALIRRDTTLYVGGSFTGIGGRTRTGIAAIGLNYGIVTNWTTPGAFGVNCLALSPTTLYVGGDFTSPGNRLCAFSLTTGGLAAFNPNANAPVLTMALNGTTLYVGGMFTTMGNQAISRIGVAAINTSAANNPTAWDAALRYGAVECMAISGSTLFLGGGFRIANALPRRYLAAFDVATGVATSWNPSPNSPVYSIDENAGTLYLGGGFTMIGGQSRGRGAAFDATGALLPWNPNASEVVTSLDAIDSTVFLGGAFAQVGGQPRSFLAAVDPVSGAVTGWNPGADSLVWKVKVDGDRVYVGGEFAVLGGVPRALLGAVDATGVTTSWDPACVRADYGPNFPNPAVFDIMVIGDDVYAGGILMGLGGQQCNNVGAVSATTGLATPFNPLPNWFVYALAHDDAYIYMGGTFYTVGGQTRYRIAAVNPTGAPTGWLADAGDAVRTLDYSNGVLYAGGSFEAVNGAPAQYLAAILGPSLVGIPIEQPRWTIDLAISPHPIRETADLRFVLPSAVPVRLELIDLAGRRVRTLARDTARPVGPQSVKFRRNGLASGLYFLRLETPMGVATRRLIVIP